MNQYFVNSSWDESMPNPFSTDGKYGKKWSLVKISIDIGGQYLFNNITGELFTLKVNPNYEGWEYRIRDYIQYENYLQT